MIGRLQKTVIYCPEPRDLAKFYCEVLGMRVNADIEDGAWVVIGTEPGDRELAFQRVAKWVPSKWPDPDHPQQLHIDIRVSDIDTAEEAVIALGARRVRGRPVSTSSSILWVTLSVSCSIGTRQGLTPTGTDQGTHHHGRTSRRPTARLAR